MNVPAQRVAYFDLRHEQFDRRYSNSDAEGLPNFLSPKPYESAASFVHMTEFSDETISLSVR